MTTGRAEGSHPDGQGPAAGDPVMIAPDAGRLITGGVVQAWLLVAHNHPLYASTFEITVAPGVAFRSRLRQDR